MAKSVLELAVGTGQWDAGLKKAKSALENFTQSQGGLQQALAKDSENMRKFVSMMGQTESTAKTAKGQMNDYKATIEQLTMQYNRMTDAQKESIGQDYLQSIDQLKQKYQAVNEEIQEMNRSLNNVKAPDIADGVKAGSLFGGGKLDGMLQVFGGNLMTKAAGLALGAVTSLTSEIEDAVKQGIELAKQGEGIRIAFERLNKPGLLDNLREATHGTVTNLELMKAAVKFNDFKLPVEELGTMLAFAQQKAKDTGQSIDYMVDSIVTGLGRKSLMILDNLGLSAAEIKEKMKETGDMTKAVGEIIREQMSKAGDYVETAADRATKADVELKNAMEDLGRVMQPLTEESNNLWNSIKVGAINALSPVMELIARMTDAGKLRNQLGNLNAPTGGMNSAVDAQLQKLRIAKAAGGSNNYVSSTYQGQIEEYNRTINAADKYVKQFESNRSKINTILQEASKEFGQKFGSMADLKAYQGAFKKMRDEYKQGAKEIMSPVKVDVKTSEAETNIESLKKKLADLESQRKKSIKAGDTEKSKSLLKEINQTKADIRGLDPTALRTSTGGKAVKTEEQLNNEEIQKLTQEYIKASDDRRKAIEVEIKGLQDRNKEIARLKDMALGKIGDDGSLPAMIQQLKELQNAQSESASGRDWDDYQKKIEDVTAKINVLKGVLSKGQQATFTVEVNAEQLEQLRMLLPSDEETVRINVEEGRIDLPDIPTEIEQVVNTKVGDVVTPEIAKELTQVVNVEPGTVNLPEIPKEDETIRVNITATTADAMKEVRDMVGEIEGWQVTIEPKIEIKEEDLRTPFEKLRDSLKIEIAEENMQVDTTTLQTLMQTSIQNGIDGLDPQFASLQDKMREGMNIPDSAWEDLQTQLNEKLKEFNIEPIKIDFKTGNIAKDGKDVAKEWNSAANAISSVGSAMQSIEDPAAKVAGTVMQAIATMALSYAQASSAAAANPANAGWGWIAFAATGLATMISSISAIHSATGYANGGIVKGNSYSGDNIPAMVGGPSGELVGLNAGEVVLNKAAQSNLANQLQGNNMSNMRLVARVKGTDLLFSLENTLQMQGYGKIATWG